jgi:hypothetical protein
MDGTDNESAPSWLTALAAPARAAAIDATDDVYGGLVGSWDLQVLHYRGQDVRDARITGEVHFGWALEGRAIQDVWIMPNRADRAAGRLPRDPLNNMYGTTLRVWDAALRAWRITWINAARDHRETQLGRRVGNEIVQTGARADGQATRWRFTEITPERFRWIGESLAPDGATWQLEGQFIATRMAGRP